MFSDNLVSNPLDIATESEINEQNTNILKDNSLNAEKAFAENSEVVKFATSHTSPTSISIAELQNNNAPNDILPDIEQNKPLILNNGDIKFVDYKNIKKDEQFIYANKFSKKFTLKSIITSAIVIALLALCGFICKYSGTSAIYYVFWISLLVGTIFYPIITALNADKLKNKFSSTKFAPTYKKYIIINAIAVLVVFLVVLIANIGIGNNTFIKIFTIHNFENLYAPILLTCSGFVDTLITYLIFKK